MSLLSFMAYHPGPAPELAWTWDPVPLGTILLVSVLYAFGVTRLWRRAGTERGFQAWQVASFAAGVLALSLALLSPLDGLSDALFSAHMSQHELLMVVAAPLMVLGRPLPAYVWTLPRPWRARVGHWLHLPAIRFSWHFLSAPLLVLVLHATVRWVWHVPALFEAALRNEGLHAVQHFTFFSSAALFWWALVHGRYGKAGYGVAALFVFATALHTSVLGALITVAPRVLYSAYGSLAPAADLAALEDQELAGLIMWVPSGSLFLIIALALFSAWLGEAERRAQRERMTNRYVATPDVSPGPEESERRAEADISHGPA
jgi:putative membrane protein